MLQLNIKLGDNFEPSLHTDYEDPLGENFEFYVHTGCENNLKEINAMNFNSEPLMCFDN